MKSIPLSILMTALENAGAHEIESITTEQATQIYNAAQLSESISSVIDEIKAAAENDVESIKEQVVDLVSNVDMALTTLCGSLGITKTEVTKAANVKIVAANKPKEPVKKKAEKQIDIEDEPTED